MLRPILRFLAIAMIAISYMIAASAQEGRIDIFQIFDRFILTNAAAAKCLKPNADLFAKFQANYLGVMAAVSVRLREKHPAAATDVLEAMMKRRVDELTAKTDELIAKEGCAGESIAQLLKMFEFHANWNMFGAPRK